MEAIALKDPKAMNKLSYGLYVLTTREGDKDNGCIINTATQITDNPKIISIAVNKANFTRELIVKSNMFNISVLDESAPFELFKRFGFQSGANVEKFKADEYPRTKSGVYLIPDHTCAYLSCQVKDTIDFGSHSLFIAEVKEADVLSQLPPMTYAYYHANVKPKPKQDASKKRGYVCKICGYVYEGDELPDDFICPICKHGKDDFEPLN